jgi:NADPH-dependent curcumin reductase CurA|tara:strand:+ start:3827 stop:4825 length:999 start_codon:yes stop_codon:yes gene_type:complete
MSGTYKKIVAHKYSKNFREASEIVSADIVQPGPGQLLIKTHFGGVNASDVNISGGVYFSDGNFPFDLGCESVGEVVAIGPDVTQFEVGDAVASPQMGSAYSEMLCRDVDQFIKVPQCSPEYLSVSVAGLTASIGLYEAGDMSSGETVLITAAAGGVGNWCVQLAKLAGNHVIGTCSTPEKAQELKSLGCDRVVVYSEEDLGVVLAAEYPDGIDLIFEQVGGATFDTCVDHLATRGRILICGFISEYMGGTQEVTAPRIYHKLLWKSAQIRAFLYKDWPDQIAGHLERLIEQVANGSIKPLLDPTVFEGIDSAAEALDYLHSGRNTGKVVVRY